MCLGMLECWEGTATIPLLVLAGMAVPVALFALFRLATGAGRHGAGPEPDATQPAACGADLEIYKAGVACSLTSSCGVLASESGPDIHLVMNTFNRIAGESRFDDCAVAEPIFALSDYLRQCLVHTGPVQVALHEEIDLLQSYLRLAAIFHGRDLRPSVELAPGSGEVRVQAHSICLVAQVLLAGLSDESQGRYVLPVRVQGSSTGGIDVHMALRVDSRSTRPHLRQLHHLRAELRRLAALMSRRSVRWTCRVVRDRHSDIAVSLRIRPRPAH